MIYDLIFSIDSKTFNGCSTGLTPHSPNSDNFIEYGYRWDLENSDNYKLLLILMEFVSIPFKPGSSNKRFVLYKVGSDVIVHSIKEMLSLSAV